MLKTILTIGLALAAAYFTYAHSGSFMYAALAGAATYAASGFLVDKIGGMFGSKDAEVPAAGQGKQVEAPERGRVRQMSENIVPEQTPFVDRGGQGVGRN